MKIKVLKDESKELMIEFDTKDLTIPDLIASELVDEDDTEFAGVSKDHPETGNVVLVLKSKKQAKSELLKAIGRLDEQFAELKEQLGPSKRAKKQ
ncbi:MAG: RpoL/Rpb11 RNA polymerase subunit family protein [Candidatus Micrarchaeaceae archaeon]